MVRLQTLPVDRSLLREATPVELTMLAKNGVYCAPARVLSEQEGKLTLAFLAPPRQRERRHEKRTAYTAPVLFRTIHARGCYGAWQSGTSADLSRSGMRLLMDAGIDAAKHVELLLTLQEANQGQDCAEASDESLAEAEHMADLLLRSQEQPIKIEATLTYQLRHPDGRSAVGLTFTRINPSDQFRIVRFLNDA